MADLMVMEVADLMEGEILVKKVAPLQSFGQTETSQYHF